MLDVDLHVAMYKLFEQHFTISCCCDSQKDDY